MEVHLLGAVEAWAQGRQLELGPRKQRLALAVLALNVNQLVTVDRLVDLTWTSSPPPTAHHAIHVRVSALRATLARARGDLRDAEIFTHGSAYVLRTDPMCVDVHRFRALVAAARADTADADKVSLFRRALDMWNGPPLADVATPEVADQLCRGLEEARLTAIEECLDAELRLGRHRAVIDELTELAAQYPYRQQLLAQLMLALYRAGRAAEALGIYKVARSRLIDELGLDPEPPLQQLQHAILRTDPTLDLPLSAPNGAPIRILSPRPSPSSHSLQTRGAGPVGEVTIEARGLGKRFGARVAVEDLSFVAREGEVVGLLGPNGAGKTTTIRLLSTVLAPSSGEFTIAGVPGSRESEVRQRVGVLPESAGYPGHQTGRDYLCHHARLFGLSRHDAARIAERLLTEVGLAERATSRIATYSRGMRQRLGIARALVNNPTVVLLDEPTLRLDPAGQRQVLTIVRNIASDRGATVILSTPILSEVDDVCTSVLNLDQGRIVEPGTGGDHTSAEDAQCTGRLWVPGELVSQAARALNGIPGLAFEATSERPDIFIVHLTVAPGAGRDHVEPSMNIALQALLDANVPLLSFEIDGTRLSDAVASSVENADWGHTARRTR